MPEDALPSWPQAHMGFIGKDVRKMIGREAFQPLRAAQGLHTADHYGRIQARPGFGFFQCRNIAQLGSKSLQGLKTELVAIG
jgi:hypothetical protein